MTKCILHARLFLPCWLANKFNYSVVSGESMSVISLLLSPVMQYFSSLLIGDEKSSELWVQSERESCFLVNAIYITCHVGRPRLNYITPSSEWCLENNFNTQGDCAVVSGPEAISPNCQDKSSCYLSGVICDYKRFFYAIEPSYRISSTSFSCQESTNGFNCNMVLNFM